MPSRQLSNIERYFYNRRKLGLHSCFYLAVKFNRQIDDNHLSYALKETINEFPQLHSNVFNDETFERIEPITVTIHFKDVVSFLEEEELSEDLINKIFKTVKFNYNEHEVLWRLLVLKNRCTFILCVDHVLFDGMSTVKFWEKFIGALNNDEPKDDDKILHFHSSIVPNLPPHPYDLIPITFKWILIRWLIRIILALGMFPYRQEISDKQFRLPGYSFPSGLFERNCNTQTIRNDNRQVKLHICNNGLTFLLSQCKRHNVSLTSMFVATIIYSLRSNRPASACGTLLKIDLPMNTRVQMERELNLNLAQLDMGNYIKNGELTYDLSQTEGIWNIAKDINEQIDAKKNDFESINMIKLLDFADNEKLIREKTKAKYPGSTFEVTNLGSQSFQSSIDDKFHIVNALFNEPQSISDIFTFSLVSSSVGGLNCCISCPKDIFDELNPTFNYMKEILKEYSSPVTTE